MGSSYHKHGINTFIETSVTYYIGLANSNDNRGTNNALEYSKNVTDDIVEPTGGGYVRLSVSMDNAIAIPTQNGQQIKNSNELIFNFSGVISSGISDGGNLNQVTHWFLCKLESGNSELLASGKLDNAPITPANNVKIVFPIGSIAIGIITE